MLCLIKIKYSVMLYYKLRHDLKRSFVMSQSYVGKNHSSDVRRDWLSKIHPIFAMILSFASFPITVEKLIEKVSCFLDISIVEAEKFIKPLICNTQNTILKYGDEKYIFPKNIIIDVKKQFTKNRSYKPEQFSYNNIDTKQERLYIAPLSIVFMVNNTCLTDCVYCYANKTKKVDLLSFDRVKEIVKQAYNLGVQRFSIVGGEFFLYKNWKELLDILIQCDLREVMISTKIPLSEKDIIALKQYDLLIQISLDAIDKKDLSEILNVNNKYAEKIKRTISLLDKHCIPFKIATVLTKYNESIDNLKSIHNFASKFTHLTGWSIRVGFKSLYSRGDFDEIKLPQTSIVNIDNWVKSIKDTSEVNISWSIETIEKYFCSEKGSRNFKGPRCSANYSNMFILPDGKVTICEQLYWNPRFIIGDLSTQSITEVWNSPRALELSFPKRDDFRENSACKHCEIFDECFNFPNKCFADVLKGYGDENWDYPDPRCNKAPEFIYNLNHN